MIDNLIHPKLAAISVSDKSRLLDLCGVLNRFGIRFVSTGGTYKKISTLFPVKEIAELTGFPEMMDGRVKTLHPKVHGGLLAIRDNVEHRAAMKKHGIKPIDLLIVNLYPFEETVRSGASFADCVENIDIGGPAMIRSAAKNHHDVVVITNPADYDLLLTELREHKGATTETFRKKMAAKAFKRTAAYEAAIADFMDRRANPELFERRTHVSRDLCGND